MSVQSARFRPQPKPELGDYQLDAVAVVYYEDTGAFDFRFELGSGLGIYLLGVSVEARSQPPWYRCRIVVRDRDRKERAEFFEWPAPHDTDARQ